MLSQELILKCFPNKECILYNLEIALSIHHAKTEEPDRVNFLCQCYHFLRNNQINEAIQSAEHAGYRCMARAIQYHYGTNSNP